MDLGRRLALLEWARETKGWVIEDDYDSEYRYAGRPLAALMSLDDGERVIYVGSFSKVMFRALRLGYMVVPETLVDAVLEARGRRGARFVAPLHGRAAAPGPSAGLRLRRGNSTPGGGPPLRPRVARRLGAGNQSPKGGAI